MAKETQHGLDGRKGFMEKNSGGRLRSCEDLLV